MTRVFVGLGSNLGDRLGFLNQAVQGLAGEGLDLVARSSVYESDAVGPPQPDYLNAVVEVAPPPGMGPVEVLEILKRIEHQVGRVETERWGPREIDLDLLLFGDEMLEGESLTVPHPEMTKRNFVLVPLLEIAPFLDLPSGEPVSAFCERDPQGLRKVGPLA